MGTDERHEFDRRPLSGDRAQGEQPSLVHARLVRNLRRRVSDLDVRAVRALMGRIETSARTGAGRRRSANEFDARFGIANFSQAGRAPLDLEAIACGILRDLGDRDRGRFRVSARRADKRFPLTSPQIEREVGGRIKDARGWTVDLSHARAHDPRRALTIEAFYFFGKERGAGRAADRHERPGGVPALGRHRLASCGMADDAPRLPRQFVHFHSYPILSRASQEKARELVKLLTRWQHRSRLFLVPFGDIQQQVVLAVRAADAGGRLPAADDAHRGSDRAAARGQALVTGEVVGQVASQTSRTSRRSTTSCRCPSSVRSSGWTRTKLLPKASASGRIPFRSSRIRTAARFLRLAIRRPRRDGSISSAPRRRCRLPTSSRRPWRQRSSRNSTSRHGRARRVRSKPASDPLLHKRRVDDGRRLPADNDGGARLGEVPVHVAERDRRLEHR